MFEPEIRVRYNCHEGAPIARSEQDRRVEPYNLDERVQTWTVPHNPTEAPFSQADLDGSEPCDVPRQPKESFKLYWITGDVPEPRVRKATLQWLFLFAPGQPDLTSELMLTVMEERERQSARKGRVDPFAETKAQQRLKPVRNGRGRVYRNRSSARTARSRRLNNNQ